MRAYSYSTQKEENQMPYAYYMKTEGAAFAATFKQQMGHKMSPHVKSLRVDQPYSLTDWRFTDGNTGVLGIRSSGTLWGEQVPTHQYLGSVQSNSFSFGSLGNQAYARAYTKFKEKVYTQASNLTALRERGKTIDMMVNRLKQLHKGASALKRGRFREFLGTFGLKPKPKHVHKHWARPKDFGALWLEYWMGWAPTVGDVYTTLEFLGKPVPTEPVRAGSTVPYVGNFVQTSGSSRATSTWEGKVTVWLKAQVEVTNPSLFDLNGLGLINPLKTLWETVAFSWFVDWFTNVGQILGQLTDWVGLKLKGLVVSCKTKTTCSYKCTGARSIFGSSVPDTMYRNREFAAFSRKTGGTLPIVRPVAKLPNGLSLTRGATLVSLLVTIFAPNKAKPH